MPTLRDLIERHIDRTGESRRALGNRSDLSSQTLSTWFTGNINAFPDPDTIRKFAAATGYAEQTVVLAVASTVGLRITQAGTPLINSLPPGTDILSPEDVDAIRAVVRQLIEARLQRPVVPRPDLTRVEGFRLSEDESATPRPADSQTNERT